MGGITAGAGFISVTHWQHHDLEVKPFIKHTNVEFCTLNVKSMPLYEGQVGFRCILDLTLLHMSDYLSS